MAPKQSPASSGSEGDLGVANHDLKKMKRKESNRLSAMRSRQKKQQQLAELNGQVSCLTKDNEAYFNEINVTTERYLNVASQNDVLRAQVAELTDRLRSLNDVIHVASVVNGVAFDTQEIPHNPPEQWQLPFPAQPISLDPWQLLYPSPIAASANNFPY